MRRRLYYFSWQREWLPAAAAAVVLLVVYGLSMPQSVEFEDAGLITAVCYNFGVQHPPGYPLYTLLCAPFAGLADLLPLNPAQTVAWLSALAGAGACFLFYEVARRFAVAMPLAVAAAVALGLGGRFWSQAIIPEVYTLNALLVVATLAAILRVLRRPSRRRVLWLGLLGGLGLANHWPLYVVNAPAFLLLLAGGWRRLWACPRLLLGGLGMTVLGLAPYLYLLLRHYIEPPPLSAFTPPTDWDSLWAYITREVYTNRAEAIKEWTQCAGSAWWGIRLLMAEYSPLGAAIALLGALCFYRRRPLLWSMAVLFGVLASAPLLFAYLCGNLDDSVSRTALAAYPLPAMIFLMLLIAEALNRLPSPVRTVAAAALAIAVGAANWTHNNRAHDRLGDVYAKAILAGLPADAAYLTSSDFDFGVFYHHHVLGVRPDITLVGGVEELLAHPGRRFHASGLALSDNTHDWGIVQEWLADDAPPIPLPPSLTELYRRLAQRYSAFDSDVRGWEKVVVRRGLFDAGRALAIADYRKVLSPEATAVKRVVSKTPEGAFGQLTARLQGLAAPITYVEIRDALVILRQSFDGFFPAWRAQIMHREGVLDMLAGRRQAARRRWQEALALDAAPDNPVLVDLLQLLAAENDWHAYRQLRRRYFMVRNPALSGGDAACAAALAEVCDREE